METKNPIQVADKLFLVLETLARTGPIGLSDLCREVSLNKTTVHRLLNSLLYMGYVRQDTQTSRYSLSFKNMGYRKSIRVKNRYCGRSSTKPPGTRSKNRRNCPSRAD